MVALPFRASVTDCPIDIVVSPFLVFGMGVGVVSQNRIALREALLYLGLQRIVVVVGIVAEVAKTLGPSKLTEERSAQVCAEPLGKTDYGW